MKKMLLLADDFTGANDSGIKIVQRGYDATVSLDSNLENESQILIIDTESRNLGEKESYVKTDNLVKKIKNLDDYILVYKKVDSTLRGNIKAECEVLIKYLDPKYVIFAPAHPRLGRITKSGIHYVNGERIINSEFARDPEKPVNNDDIRSILSKDIKHHDLAEIRSDLRIEPGINTFDCEKYDDLLKISRKSLELEEKVLYIGSAGLCDAIFDELIIKKPALAIVGSVSSQNKESIEYCKSMGIKIIKISLMDYVKNLYRNKLNSVLEFLDKNKDVLIVTSENRKDYMKTLKYLKENNIKPDDILSNLLKEISEKVLKNCEISGVLTTGGTTSIQFLNSINADGTKLISEIENGVILSKVYGIEKDLYLVTKAGAFGNEKTIYNSLNEIRRVSR